MPDDDQTAIERARQDAKVDLLEHLRSITPSRFEHVIRLLLDALGYEDVIVTGHSGDHGIDVKSILRYRGVAEVPTFIQAKRYKAGNNVTPPAVGRLRGSLPVETNGFVITTSDFSKQAREEARGPGLKPIALINGADLVELLVDLGIGVTKRTVEVIRFDPSKMDEDLSDGG